ncbi:MAG: hypothetical protein SVS15_10505, partial [Thermodesulfobacteriota bacterium]|nr:hypothetical protein [Thermodesulfobacteriota bacterium]
MATPNGEAETKGEKISRLLKLAEKEFGTLSEAEKKFFLAAASGEIADYRAEKEEDNDPTKAKDWGPERVLNADRIAWLCTDSLASSLVTHKGVWVNGAGIEGHLDLKFAQISFPLFFRGSAFPYGINFQHAELRGLHLPGTHTGPILAEGINVKGDILLWDGFLVNGGMRLTGATINRNLECGGGRFINKEGEAFNAEGINVKGSVFLDEFFIAEGEVCLSGAVIGGNLVCGNGKFFNQKGKAFLAKGLNVNGSVFFNNIFQSIGEVNLLEATINGSLNCDG